MSDEDRHRKDGNLITQQQQPTTTKRQPALSKYATISSLPTSPSTATTEKSNKKFPDFDKYLTVEKAKFDSSSSTLPSLQQTQLPTSSISTPIVSPIPPPHTVPPLPSMPATSTTTEGGDTVPTATTRTKSPPLTTSVTLPIVTTLQSLKDNQQQSGGGGSTGHSTPTNTTTATTSTITALPSQSTPLLTKSKPKVEDRRSIKRKKLPPLSGTATPSEVFHRNLVDAVSNVEDSDENEQYVYPYSGGGNNTDTTFNNPTSTAGGGGDNNNHTLHRTTSSLYRPQSTRSFIQQQQDQASATTTIPKRGSSTGFLGDFLRPILFKSKSEASQALRTTNSINGDEQPHYHRPKLRNYVMDHPFNKQQQNIPADWSDTPSSYGGGGRRQKKFYSNNYVIPTGGGVDGGYTTDDEEAQHLLANVPTSRRSFQQQQQRNKSSSRSSCSRLIRNLLISLLTLFILFFLLITYIAKPLQELNVEMGRVLSSDKELIFDLHIHAINSNFWTVHVADADISVFAFSQVVPSSSSSIIANNNTSLVDARGVDPAEYLGGFYHFDEPLSFSSGGMDPVTAISQIRIKSPGADKSGNERWSRMIRYPYGLVVRGVLKYKPLMVSPYPQSVAICDVVRVNPTTGKVSEDPDQGFCLNEDNNDNHTIATTLFSSSFQTL